MWATVCFTKTELDHTKILFFPAGLVLKPWLAWPSEWAMNSMVLEILRIFLMCSPIQVMASLSLESCERLGLGKKLDGEWSCCCYLQPDGQSEFGFLGLDDGTIDDVVEDGGVDVLSYQHEQRLQPVVVHLLLSALINPLDDPPPAPLVLVILPVRHDPFLRPHQVKSRNLFYRKITLNRA